MTAPVIDAPTGALDFESALMWAELLDETAPTVASTEFDIEVFDNSYGSIGMIADHESVKVEWRRNSIGPAQLVIHSSNEFARLFMECDETVIPVRITYNGKHYDGRVDFAEARGIKDSKVVTVDLVDNYVWFHAILAYPMPWPGIEEVQLGNVDWAVGPIKSVVLGFIERNVNRLKLRTGQCPITVLPWDRKADKTEWIELDGRMTYLADLFEDALSRSNCELRIRAWISGRDPQPMPDKIWLTESQLIVDVVEHEKVTGSVDLDQRLDGLQTTILESIAETLEEFLGIPLPHLAGQVAATLDGSPLPKVVWSEDSEGIIDATAWRRHPKGYSTVIGGKSPDALNKLLQGGLEWGVNALLATAGLVIPGLASAVKGIFNNMLFAFMKATDFRLKAKLGKWALPETFTNGGPVAYSVSGKFLADQGLHDAKGQRGHRVEVVDWLPWGFVRDYDIGHVVGWEDWGQLHCERVESVTVSEDRSEPVHAIAEIGETKAGEAPGQATIRKLRYLMRAVDAAVLAPMS